MDEKEEEIAPLNENVTTSADYGTILINDELQTLADKHGDVVHFVSSTFTRVLYIGVSCSLTYTLRTNLFVLYCKTFNDYGSSLYIGIAIYCSYVVSAIMSLTFGIIGDRFRFDILLLMAGVLDVLTFFMEAKASNFVILAVAYAIGGQPFEAIVHGWNIKMQPLFYAQKFQARFLQCYTLGYLAGPVLGGIIAYFFSYRTVFYVSAVLGAVLLVYQVVMGLFRVEPIMLDKIANISAECYSTADHDQVEIQQTLELEENHKWIISKDYRFHESQEDKQLQDNGILHGLSGYQTLLLCLVLVC